MEEIGCSRVIAVELQPFFKTQEPFVSRPEVMGRFRCDWLMRFSANNASPTSHEEVQIRPLGSLGHVLHVELHTPAIRGFNRSFPLLTTALKFFCRHMKLQQPGRDVQLNLIAVLHESEGPPTVASGHT